MGQRTNAVKRILGHNDIDCHYIVAKRYQLNFLRLLYMISSVLYN